MKVNETLLSVLFITLIALVIYAMQQNTPVYIHAYTWYSWAFFAAVHFILKALSSLQKGIKASRSLITVVYGGVALKLFAGVAYILFFLAQKPENPVVFVVNFFILYFLFSGFEIYLSLANLRAQSNK